MRAAVYNDLPLADGSHLHIEDVPCPQLQPGHLLVRVIACGVWSTDLHIVEGDLAALRARLIPGHQIVGEVVEGATADRPLGSRVGIFMDGRNGWRLLVLQTKHRPRFARPIQSALDPLVHAAERSDDSARDMIA